MTNHRRQREMWDDLIGTVGHGIAILFFVVTVIGVFVL
jgi:hypothetical protein